MVGASGAGRALDLLAALRIEDGRRWGDVATDWQRDDAAAVVARDGPRRHFLLRARGMSKTSDAGGLSLALLVAEAPPASRSYCFAVDQEQAGLLADSVAGFVMRAPVLASALDVAARRLTARRTGATLDVMSADAASAFGLRPWLTVVDELTQMPSTTNHRRLWSSVVSAVPKVPGSRLVVLASAGSPTHWSREVWDQAEVAEHWHTSSTSGPCPWWTADEVAAVRADLTESEYRRLVLNEWAEGDDSLCSPEDVAASVMPGVAAVEPQPGRRYVVAVDIGTRRDRTAVAVAHAEPAPGGGRRVVVDRVLRWTGTRTAPVDLDDVESAAASLSAAYHQAPVRFDLHQAAQLVERLRKRGVRTSEYVFSVAGVNRLARTLYVALRDRLLSIPDDPALVSELASVRMVETGPGLVKLDNPPGTHDDQAVAVAMCAAHLWEQGGPREARAASAASVSSHEDRLRQARRWYDEVPAR
jgi:phage terminase large subunit-like protein